MGKEKLFLLVTNFQQSNLMIMEFQFRWTMVNFRSNSKFKIQNSKLRI